MKILESFLKVGAKKIRRGKYPCGQVKVEGLISCPLCEKNRWVDSHNIRRATFSGLCSACTGRINVVKAHLPENRPRGPKNHNFKRGFWITDAGYIELHLAEIDPKRKFVTSKSGKIFQHRLVMAEHLGRPLKSWEHVHHLNGKKDDNRIENLELLPNGVHALVTRMATEIQKLQAENERLKYACAHSEK